MALARQVLDRAARTSRGSVLLVTGDAGMGKSALLEEVRRYALAADFVLGSSKADEAGQISPGAPLLSALRSGPAPLLGREDFAELAELVSHPLLLVDRISGHLEKIAAGGVLIAVDDVQWADWLSVFALRTLASRLAGLPVVWLFASRDDAAQLVEDISVPGSPATVVQSIDLGPLPGADVVAIARDRLGRAPTPAAQRMLEGIGGNPFLALQIIEGLTKDDDGDDRPPVEFVAGVRRALSAQQPLTRQLIRLAAVLGRSFTLDDAVGLESEQPIAAVAGGLREAVLSGLLIDDGPTTRFKHDLVREAVYADLGEQVRRGLHRRCAVYLLHTGDRLLEAARHARAMGAIGDDDAVTILRRAADEAITAMPRTAGELILEAFHLTPAHHPEWLQIGEHCVSILCQVQRGTDALSVADRLLSSADLDPDAAARIQVLAVRALWLMGGTTEAVARVQGALSRPGIGAPLQARLHAARALALSHSIPAVARPAAAAALSYARRTEDRAALMVALQAVGESAKNSGWHTESLASFHELRHLAGAPYLAQEIMVLQVLDRFDEADGMLKAAWLDVRPGSEGILPSLMEAQLWQDVNLGRLGDAEAVGRTHLSLSRELGNQSHELTARMLLGAMALSRGNPQEARRRIQPVIDGSVTDAEVRSPSVQVMLGLLEAAEGRPVEATRILGSALYSAREESTTFWPWWPGWMQSFCAVGLASGDQRFIEECCAVAREGAARNPGVASFEGVALHVRGRADEDLGLLSEASAVLGAGPRPILHARCADDYGRLLLTRGQRAEGIRQLDQAWTIFRRSGLTVAALSVQHALRKAGIRRAKWTAVTARPATGWDALTETEAKVARLVGAGHSNRSAAGELGVSPNTVGTHLRSVFAKLEIQSRVQLSNRIRERAR
jgi:DNA-binding CsgD family transcriptional regulator